MSLERNLDSIFFRCVEDCGEPIMISDRMGRLQYVNPAWIQTYGYSLAEAAGETPRILRSHYQSDDFYQKMWTEIQDPKIGYWRGEVVNKAKDGRFVPVLLTITPYKQKGETIGYMGIAVDLTERRTMERQILRQDRLANVGMLASSLAHEIGNPLGVIRGRAEILLDQFRNQLKQAPSPTPAGPLADSPTVQSLSIIVGQIDRIAKLIDSLLKISRVPQEVALSSVRVRGTVSEVVALIEETCRRKGIQISCEVDDVNVAADPQHLQQILLNLTINAIHAMEEQSRKSGVMNHRLTISVHRDANNQIALKVSDTGCGLTEEVKRRMFEPFYTTKSLGQGTGLGLAIVSRLVEEMKGKLDVESPGPGLGTTFTLSLHELTPSSGVSGPSPSGSAAS